MDDDARPPPSLFLVLSYEGIKSPYCISVLRLETPVNNDEHELETLVNNCGYEAAHLIPPVQVKRLLVDQQDYVSSFRVPPECPRIKWLFSPPTISTEDLYMVPDWDGPSSYPNHYVIHKRPPSKGYKFSFRTGGCEPIKLPKATKLFGSVVNGRGGHIYYMADPDSYYDTPDPVFECYDPDTNKWKALEPFPDHAVHRRCFSIMATAVLDDTILYNMGGCRIWAYYVPKDKWYIVHVEDDRCYGIVGEAVVLENTNIYALTDPFRFTDLVLNLYIEREDIDGDHVFKCSLRSVFLVPGMRYKNAIAYNMIRHLVHLGKDNFCLVHSCNLTNKLGLNKYQPIQLTNLKKMGDNSMTVTNVCLYEVEIQPDMQFEVRLCFSLPECKNTALQQGSRYVFNLDPCRQGYDAYSSLQKDNSDFNAEPEVGKAVEASTYGDGVAFERGSNAEEGYSIYVRNLPLNATVRQLKKELKKFGSIKRDRIRVIIDDTLEDCRLAAYVEFESASSKRDAIEASIIQIKGDRAEIDEKRTFGINVGSIFCCLSDGGAIKKRQASLLQC